MMKRNNYLQHLVLENTYVKFRSNELLHNNEVLQNEICELKSKLDQLYKCHANTIIMLQEKNLHLSQIIEEKNSHIRLMSNYSHLNHSNRECESELTFE